MAAILIVEDDVFIGAIAECTVQDLDHATVLAISAEEALEVLRSPRAIDALVTDVRLDARRMGGFELARQGVELRPQLRVLYTTGSSLTAEMQALFVPGGGFLQKPYTEGQLQNAVTTMLAASA